MYGLAVKSVGKIRRIVMRILCTLLASSTSYRIVVETFKFDLYTPLLQVCDRFLNPKKRYTVSNFVRIFISRSLDNPIFMLRVITVDEILVYGYNLDIKG